MALRIDLARFLLRLGKFVQSLAVVVMRPDELVEFSRRNYARPGEVEAWSEDALVDAGLSAEEIELLSTVPLTKGTLLLLGVGGGREAIPLAMRGFEVTGIDYVPEMVKGAQENAVRRGIHIKGLVQEISRLDVPAGSYDVVWLSKAMYSCVPTRARRVEMVRRIARALSPGGYLLCQFHWGGGLPPRGKSGRARTILARALGNLKYEEGDMLWLNVEFVHAFSSEAAIRSELEEGGLSVLSVLTETTSVRGRAVCRKTEATVIDL